MTGTSSVGSAVLVMGRGSADGADVCRAFEDLARRAAGEDVAAARVCHEVALLMEGLGDLKTAETFHRRAGLLLVELPTGTDVDRQRIAWARSLAANLLEQGRVDEAADVLRAASALSEGLLGPHDAESVGTEQMLLDLTRKGRRTPM